ncbi:SDR family oxidoreductase [Hydrocarboniphaga sp.]|uniref:SDR family oxidoreductase n=1 Tax=Hydrocarboniphaga sp. TaxID=2033016 RepID=UPI00345213D6
MRFFINPTSLAPARCSQRQKATGASTFVAVGASAVVMGRPMSMKNITEDLPLQSPSWEPYIKTKAQADLLVRQANSSALRTVVIRPSLIWGPGTPQLEEIVDLAKAGQSALPDAGRQVSCTAMSITPSSACSWLPKMARAVRPTL